MRTRGVAGAVLLVLVVLVVAAGAGTAWWVAVGLARAREQAAVETLETYAAAWEARDWAALAARVRPPSQPAVGGHRAVYDDLEPDELLATPAALHVDDATATAELDVTVVVPGIDESLRWTSALELVWEDGAWQVVWAPAAVHPEFIEGGGFRRSDERERRGSILDRDGQPVEGERAFATHIVGRVDELTAEQAEEIGRGYEAGDVAGVSGLQRALDEHLAGQPQTVISIVGPDGAAVADIHRTDGAPPTDVVVTLDRRVQQAAEAALAGVDEPAALVAVSVGEMGVLAAANQPVAGFDRAFAGRYPPGSTFKVVTTAALLGSGMDPETALDCPGQRNVGGRSFRNAGGLALGSITLREAFAQSCNTAYVGTAPGLEDDLAAAAAAFGFDETPHDVAIEHVGGSFPEPGDLVEAAAAAIGQARVEASPLHMATVAAAAASGRWQPATVFAEPDAAREPRDIPGDTDVLRELMFEVVTEGTGTAVQLDGEPVGGKTGSAEFGTGDPPPTHAWFIGFRGSLAFAVLVEGGGAGGEVAAPIAARFLEQLD